MNKNMVLIAVFLPALTGCIESQSLENAGKYQQSLRSAFIDQINRQLAIAVDDPYAVPIFANFSTAEVTTGGSFSLAPKWTNAPHSITREVGATLGDFGTSAKLTIAPLNATKGMLVTRDLFAYEIADAPMPASERALLLAPPPKPGWLHHAQPGGAPNDCNTKCHFIGNYGKYALYTSDQKSYSDFIILVSDAILLQEQTSNGTATAKSSDKGGKKTPTNQNSNFNEILPQGQHKQIYNPGKPDTIISPSFDLSPSKF